MVKYGEKLLIFGKKKKMSFVFITQAYTRLEFSQYHFIMQITVLLLLFYNKHFKTKITPEILQLQKYCYYQD